MIAAPCCRPSGDGRAVIGRDDQEQLLFRRLAVFTGSFNIEAAVAICAIDQLRSEAILGLVGQLIDRSLVSATGAVRGEIRYRLLETTRAYASELLSAEPQAVEVARRHAHLYASIAIEAGRRLGGPDAGDWIDLIAEEMDNLRAGDHERQQTRLGDVRQPRGLLGLPRLAF